MSIQIITGFSLNNIEPIDTRIVASGSTGRDAIPYKYQGLRVFDLSNNRPYVYVGATWSVEINDQVFGTTGSIGKFTTSNTISDSNIYQVGSNIGINTSNPLGAVQFGPATIPAAGYSLPFVIHKAGAVSGLYVGSTVLGHNWYYTSSDQYFNNSLGSSNLVFGYYGDITIKNKAGAGSIINSLYISPLGKVGIGTGFSITSQPSQSLSVSGTVSATGFVGSGAGLTNISPSSISNQNLLSAGSSVTASNVVVTNVITNATHYLTFVSSGSSTSIKTNTSGLLYNPSLDTLTTGTVSVTNLKIRRTTATANINDPIGKLYFQNGSNIQSGIESFQNDTGLGNNADLRFYTSYDFSNVYLERMRIDRSGNVGIGTTSSTLNNKLQVVGNTKFTGLLTVNGTMKHVSPTFSTPGNVASFVVGSGNLSTTTQIVIYTADHDRIIYVYSSSNSNAYYSTAGFFQIEIYLQGSTSSIGVQAGSYNQQIYTFFHGNDSDIRPNGVAYNYILPAGCSSNISLSKGNSLSWNSGNGPTIYATSLKFGNPT